MFREIKFSILQDLFRSLFGKVGGQGPVVVHGHWGGRYNHFFPFCLRTYTICFLLTYKAYF